MADVAQRFFAARGFVAVSLDFRGYGESDGNPPAAFADQEALDGLRRTRVDRAPAVVQGPDRDLGRVIRRQYRAGDRCAAPAVARRDRARSTPSIPSSRVQAWPHGCRGALVGEIDWGSRMIGLAAAAGTAVRRRLARSLAIAARRPGPAVPLRVAHHSRRHVAPLDDGHRGHRGARRSPSPRGTTPIPRETLDYHSRLPSRSASLLGPWKHELPDIAVHDQIGFFDVAARWFGHFLGARRPDAGRSRRSRSSRRWVAAGERRMPFRRRRRPSHDVRRSPTGRSSERVRRRRRDPRMRVDPTVGLAALPWDWTTPTPPDAARHLARRSPRGRVDVGTGRRRVADHRVARRSPSASRPTAPTCRSARG